MEIISVGYCPNSIDQGNEKNTEFKSYIIKNNEQDVSDSHALMFYLSKHFESGILVSGM